MAQAHRKIRHHSGNISGCSRQGGSGCTARPSREASCGEDKRDGLKPIFTLGRAVATPGALTAIEKSGQQPREFADRHISGDWGEVPPEDIKENEFSPRHGFRLLSAYRTGIGEKLWVITEADRSSTCILVPEEY
jgi:hypothetical protein